MNQQDQGENMKLVMVGDGAVGKTCILLRYTQNHFDPVHVATIFENKICKVKYNNKTINLGLWDTAGQEEYLKLRALAYSNTNIFLLTFSVIDKISFENAVQKWYPELKQSTPNATIIFVGNKTDLRVQSHKEHVSFDQAQKQIISLGCKYLECSAMTGAGVKEIFAQALSIFLEQQKKGKSNVRPPRTCQLI